MPWRERSSQLLLLRWKGIKRDETLVSAMVFFVRRSVSTGLLNWMQTVQMVIWLSSGTSHHSETLRRRAESLLGF